MKYVNKLKLSEVKWTMQNIQSFSVSGGKDIDFKWN